MTASESARGRVDRALVWKLLGEPDEQIGSVNDPRSHEEQGRVWNEKWVYWREGSREPERVVLWHRYDFLGAFRVADDGTLVPEELPRA